MLKHLIKQLIRSAFVCFATVAMTSAQTTLFVPSPQFGSIQSAIAAASPGDTVEIASGAFFENIDFLGKAITVRGQGMGNTIIDGQSLGSVVSFINDEDENSVLERVTVQNGLGQLLPNTIVPYTVGGGIRIFGTLAPAVAAMQSNGPTIRECEITGNVAQRGSAVFAYVWASIRLDDCVIENNHAPVGVFGESPIYSFSFSHVVMRRCDVTNNSPGAINMADANFHNPEGGNLLEDCNFANNTAGGSWGVAQYGGILTRISRCRFVDNQSGLDSGVLFGNGSGQLVLEDSLFADNTCGPMGATTLNVHSGGAVVTIRNCTIVQDATLNRPAILDSGSLNSVTLENSILWGHGGITPMIEVFANAHPVTAFLVGNANSTVEGGIAGYAFSVADPMFMDPANGDFHLSPGSPAIDAGTLNPMTSSLELDRMPRVVFGTVDQGCFESGDVRANPAMAGNIPPMAPPGGATTEDVLEVNGSAGGASREVTIPLGTPFSFAVQAPTMGSGVAPFVIFMRVGEPDPTEDFMITGIGPMVFWPCPAASYLQPILVTLADSLNVPGCNPVFAASPAPWVSPLIPGISFPVTTTVQGVVRVTAGQFAVTNGVVVQVR